MNFEQSLQKYAELAVKVGVNLQKEQTLVINTTIDSLELVRLVTKEAYQLGAKNVIINWTDDVVTRTKYELAPLSSFEEYPEYRAKEMEHLAKEGAAFMSIISSSPDLLKGVDPEKISANQKSSGAALKPFRQYVQSDKVSWTVVATPSEAWAQKVFSNERSKEEAVAKLWEAIFKAVRVDVADPIQAWKDHDNSLHKKVDVLNEKRFNSLHYTAPGTDLTIELPSTHIWVGAGSTNAKGEEFMANMPTEEVFTVPHKEGVNGTVASTKPLSYGGNIIDNFSITFEKGRIVKVEAKEGQDILERLVATDEGSHYLGEVALVPHQSPISDSGILFYNTLFDENASNHLAIGNAYAFCIEGGKEMSEEELEQHGLNASITHVDFMIGSAEMNIDGIKADGTKEPIFRNGNWAI